MEKPEGGRMRGSQGHPTGFRVTTKKSPDPFPTDWWADRREHLRARHRAWSEMQAKLQHSNSGCLFGTEQTAQLLFLSHFTPSRAQGAQLF